MAGLALEDAMANQMVEFLVFEALGLACLSVEEGEDQAT